MQRSPNQRLSMRSQLAMPEVGHPKLWTRGATLIPEPSTAPQAPHRAVRELGHVPSAGGVFISRWHHGSPAHRYALYGMQFITELDGQPVPDLAAFTAVAARLPDNTFVRVRLEEHETERKKARLLLQSHSYWALSPDLQALSPQPCCGRTKRLSACGRRRTSLCDLSHDSLCINP